MEELIRGRRRIEITISNPGYEGTYLYDGNGTYVTSLSGQVPVAGLDRLLSDLAIRQPMVSGICETILHYKSCELHAAVRRYIDMVLGEIVDLYAERTPEKEAVADLFYGHRLTYQELKCRIDAMAKALIGLGLQKGDHIAVIMDNSWENIVSKYAILKAGGVVVNLNIHEKASVLEILLYRSDVKMVLLRQGYKNREYMDLLYEICPGFREAQPGRLSCSKLPKLQHIIVTDQTKPRTCAWQFEQLLEDGMKMDDDILEERRKQVTPFDPASIIHTSGTGGVPKGVLLEHGQLIESAFSHVKYLEVKENDRFCVVPPMFHSLGCIGSVLTTLLKGACVICFSNVEIGELFEILKNEKCTILSSVPTIFVRLMNLIKENELDCSGLSVRVCTTAGAACPKNVLREMQTILGAESVISMYGMTEAGPGITSTSSFDNMDTVERTVGRFWPGVEWKIRDLCTGKTLGYGEKGEICIKGFGVMKGYYNNPKGTESAIDADGWLHTGDIGVVSEDGLVSLKGRCKDLIIHGGENISPKEVEEFLCKYEAIEEAAVIGVPNEEFGENVFAFVKVRNGYTLDEEVVKSWCRGKIATMKIPQNILVLDEIPLTATGKVAKAELRKMADPNENV